MYYKAQMKLHLDVSGGSKAVTFRPKVGDGKSVTRRSVLLSPGHQIREAVLPAALEHCGQTWNQKQNIKAFHLHGNRQKRRSTHLSVSFWSSPPNLGFGYILPTLYQRRALDCCILGRSEAHQWFHSKTLI